MRHFISIDAFEWYAYVFGCNLHNAYYCTGTYANPMPKSEFIVQQPTFGSAAAIQKLFSR